MKILILGGYGVFGSRLARLLALDAHDVCIAGRNLTAGTRIAAEIGARAIRLDRAGDLSAIAKYDAVIDAAGPFHIHGADPYRLPKAAIAAKVHYLDLADNAAFCEGIAALDAEATAARVCVLSGMSSVPALSSAAVRALAGEESVRMIETAILPGNRSPRGASVMHSILSQSGRPIRVWRDGRWTLTHSWSDPATYDLPDGSVRQGWQIEVPDTRLFPAYFGAESVLFRAGLELAVMLYGLAAFAWLRRRLSVPINRPVLRLFKFLADALAPFGTGKGGMSVTVVIGQERRFWRLIAEDGDGPFIPAVSARAILRRDQLPTGAGPGVCAITLAEAEAAMSDLRVKTERQSLPVSSPFAQVLGADFFELPEIIRQTHLTLDQSVWRGRASVTRGNGVWSRLLGFLFRFPKRADSVDVEVTKTACRNGETWIRRFGRRRFQSRLSATADGMTESFGPLTFLLKLEVFDGQLHYPVRSGRLGPVSLPKWLLPAADAREFVQDGRFHFDVSIFAPFSGALIVRYQGWLERRIGRLRQKTLIPRGMRGMAVPDPETNYPRLR